MLAGFLYKYATHPFLITVAVRNPLPPSEATLFRFETEADLARWKVFTDQKYGGRTIAQLRLAQEDQVKAY